MKYINEFNEKVVSNNVGLDKETTLEMNEEAGIALSIARDDDLVFSRMTEKSEAGALFFKDHNYLMNIGNTVQVNKSTIWEEILAAPLTDDLKKITIPSLMIWGKYDFVVAPSLGVEMMEELGTPEEDKSLIIFEDSGHSPMVSETDKFVQVVIDFIERYK